MYPDWPENDLLSDLIVVGVLVLLGLFVGFIYKLIGLL